MPSTRQRLTPLTRYILSAIPAAVASALVGGCAVGPDYVSPETELPQRWQHEAVAGLSRNAPPVEYWSTFGDPVLANLVQRAELGNQNLQIAWWNIEKARLQTRLTAGEYAPRVNAEGSYRRSRVSENGLNPPSERNPANFHSFGAAATWELDVFGRVARTLESAEASEEAAHESYRDVMVMLYGDVAGAYGEARTLQKRLAIAQSNIVAQRQTLALAEARFASELVTGLDVAQARSNLANTEATVPQIRAALRRVLNRIDFLLGTPPSTSARNLLTDGQLPDLPSEIAVGMPADLLRRRPDIRRSERELAAQTARIGAATARLYPAFTLTGSLTLEAVDFADLGYMASRATSFGPRISWNIFDGNRIRNQIKIEEASTEQALIVYEQTVLSALREVEDSANDYIEEIA